VITLEKVEDRVKIVFNKNNGYATMDELRKNGITYYLVQKYYKEGKIIRIRRGLYQWHETDRINETATITGLFPDGILCMDTALFFYGYSDQTPGAWHVAVNKDTSKTRFNLPYPFVKPYYYEPKTLNLGISKELINGIKIKIYNRDKTICDCLRNINKMNKEIFNKAVQGYISDPRKNISNLITFAKKLRVYKKVQDLIGVWL
jgi:predicted transcriptional regulator of viral defense system